LNSGLLMTDLSSIIKKVNLETVYKYRYPLLKKILLL
jgi:hypothetical protein